MGFNHIADISAKDLREIVTQNNILYAKEDSAITFANDCGTVRSDDLNISYNAYLLIEGGFEDMEDKHSMGEFANAEYNLYTSVARRALPTLRNLGMKYENHSLDAGLANDGWGRDADYYIRTWLSIKEWEQFRYPDGASPMTAKERAFELLATLNRFTRANTHVYQEAIIEYREHPHYSFLKGKSFKPQLPNLIKEKLVAEVILA